MLFDCLFFFMENSIFGSAFCGLSFLCALMFFLFVPRNYIINNEGIRVFYGFKMCNFITWKSIHSIDLWYDVRFDLFWFYKDFVVSHNNMKGYVRLIDTVTKTKRTELEIKKYWWTVFEWLSCNFVLQPQKKSTCFGKCFFQWSAPTVHEKWSSLRLWSVPSAHGEGRVRFAHGNVVDASLKP